MNALIEKLPKKYQPMVRDYYMDDDGYWLCLKQGYSLECYDSETVIHEDTQTEVLYVLRHNLKTDANTWGGKREGAGRKKDDTVKVRWNVTVTPEEKQYLQHMLFMYRAKNVQK